MDEEKIIVKNDSDDSSEKIDVIVKGEDEEGAGQDDSGSQAVETRSESSESKSNDESDEDDSDQVGVEPDNTDTVTGQSDVGQLDSESSQSAASPSEEDHEKIEELTPPPDDEEAENALASEAHMDVVAQSDSTSEEGLAPVAQPPEEEYSQNLESSQSSEDSHIDHGAMSAMSMSMSMSANETARHTTEPGESAVYNDQNTQAQAKSPHPHRNNKKFAIAMVAVVGLLLAGIAVYVYMSTANNTAEVNNAVPAESSKPNSGESANNAESKVAPATTQDVDAASDQLDQAVQSLDDTSDLGESQISDQALGL